VTLVNAGVEMNVLGRDYDQRRDFCQMITGSKYFVGILGERYGWVPKSCSDEFVSKYGWVQHQTGKSVTEFGDSLRCAQPTNDARVWSILFSAIRCSWATCRKPSEPI
jgi:hypothetical protein